MMAKKLGVHRSTLWRHRKEHLRMYLSKKPAKTAELSFEERARLLATDADRLQCMCENGLPGKQFDEAMRALALRVRLLEMEAKFAGRPMTQKREPIELEDPDETAQVLREFEEVVGTE